MNACAKLGYYCLLTAISFQTVAGDVGSKLTEPKNIVIPSIDYSHADFDFNSVVGSNYQTFKGYSNQYKIGADIFLPKYTLTVGGQLYQVDTALTSNTFILPSAPSMQNQTIRNDLLYLHATKYISLFRFDVAGAYGQYKLKEYLIISPDTINQLTGYGSNTNNNWFTSVTGIYSKTWNEINVTGQIQFIHGEANSKQLYLTFTDNSSISVMPLVTKSNWAIENIKATYPLNHWFRPYITAGLVQVLNISTSRPLIDPFIAGIPQLSVTQNGYTVGGGFLIQHKKFNLTVEDGYYQAGSIYHNNQVVVRLAYLWY